MAAIRPGFPDYQVAVGLFAYYQIEDLRKTGQEPRIELCPQCGGTHRLHWYAVGWCDQCAIDAGYLPATAHEDEELTLYRAMFNELRSKGYDWPAVAHFTKYWSINRHSLCKGDFKPWWISEVFDKPLSTAVCNWPGCGKALGRKSVAGYCGNTCYMRAYRRDNHESIKLRRILRNMPGDNNNES